MAIAIVAGPTFLHPAPQIYATGAASRTLALADGSRVVLAPRSRLVISGSNASAMQLTGGAWFDVHHVAARELAISAGPITIRDIGTRFDVQEDGNLVRVAVAQGHVEVVSPALSQAIALDAGRALLFDGQRGVASVAATDVAAIGGWRRDRLTYDNAPLALVADDLGRYAGIQLDVPAELLSRRFSGTLIIGHGIEAPRDLAQLMGLALVRGHSGLRLAVRGNRAAAD
jgi:transmembrane sensor